MRYKHLYRNKWLCLKALTVKPWYYDGEVDKDDVPLKKLWNRGDLEDFEHLEIIISDENPNYKK